MQTYVKLGDYYEYIIHSYNLVSRLDLGDTALLEFFRKEYYRTVYYSSKNLESIEIPVEVVGLFFEYYYNKNYLLPIQDKLH